MGASFADFNQDGKPDNISFMVKRIKVHSMDALKDSTYRFPLNYGVEKFLELFSGTWSFCVLCSVIEMFLELFLGTWSFWILCSR
jgi:hypothetical protein